MGYKGDGVGCGGGGVCGDFWGFVGRRMMVFRGIQTVWNDVYDKYVGASQRSASIYIYIYFKYTRVIITWISQKLRFCSYWHHIVK